MAEPASVSAAPGSDSANPPAKVVPPVLLSVMVLFPDRVTTSVNVIGLLLAMVMLALFRLVGFRIVRLEVAWRVPPDSTSVPPPGRAAWLPSGERSRVEVGGSRVCVGVGQRQGPRTRDRQAAGAVYVGVEHQAARLDDPLGRAKLDRAAGVADDRGADSSAARRVDPPAGDHEVVAGQSDIRVPHENQRVDHLGPEPGGQDFIRA